MILSIQWDNYDVKMMKNRALFSSITKISSMGKQVLCYGEAGVMMQGCRLVAQVVHF